MGHTPISKRAGVKRLQRIKKFWTPLLTLIWFDLVTKFGMVRQMEDGRVFRGQTRPLS